MDYSDTDLDRANAELRDAERRRDWMSGVVTTLRAGNHHARAAERQLAVFAAMTAAMRQRRKEIEDAIMAQRESTSDAAPSFTASGPAAR